MKVRAGKAGRLTAKAVASTMRVLQISSAVAGMALASPAIVQAQSQSPVSIAPMPLEAALQQIQQHFGVRIEYDPSAVPGNRSSPVRAATSAEQAVQQAIGGTILSVWTEADGSLAVAAMIVVTAQRDEAETSIVVRQASTSNRNGTSLRDQPRNATVISSKLIEEQQASTVRDALRYAGGVTGDIDSAQGQGTFSVRGFPVAPLSNGMTGAGTVGNLGGTGGGIDMIERIEVLKGPDALLSGSGNLGGVVNVVTKKPSADPFAEVTAESSLTYGDWRMVADVNGALTEDDLISARLIASLKGGDLTYGGYEAADGYTIAPSIRFKNAKTDILFSASLTDEFVPISPYVIVPFGETEPLKLPRDKPILGPNQGINIETQQYLLDFSHDFSANLMTVLRYQHIESDVRPGADAILGADVDGNAFITTDDDYQSGPTDSFDGYVRARFLLGPVRNTLNVGVSYAKSTSNVFSALGDFFTFNVLTDDPSTLPPRPTDYTATSTASFEQKGYYIQNLMEYGRLHVVAALRRTDFKSRSVFYPYAPFGITEETVLENEDGATTPSLGVVVDVNNDISIFANYLEGFLPTYSTAFDGSRLPNVKSKNREAGVKVDMFGDRGVLNVSYFQNAQSNVLVADPINGPPFQIAADGRQAKGFDVNFSGEIYRGWFLIASYTHTEYENLSEEFADFLVTGAPKETYSLYSSYAFSPINQVRASIGAGVTGRSSAYADVFGTVVSPSAAQIDVNGLVSFRNIDVRLGIRNLLDRENYDISFAETQLPIAEPRNVRLTVGYKF